MVARGVFLCVFCDCDVVVRLDGSLQKLQILNLKSKQLLSLTADSLDGLESTLCYSKLIK